MSEQLENIKNSIEKIKNKDFGIYFFTLDTKGNPTAGVATIYEHVKKLGYQICQGFFFYKAMEFTTAIDLLKLQEKDGLD